MAHGRKPDFIIIGAAKAATTWLQTNLQQDSRVFMPEPELHFFSRDHDRGERWYLDQFAKAGRDQIVGEKSNSYLDVTEAAQRLHAMLPDARLIVQLRNPVERAYSDYCMLYRRGEVSDRIHDYFERSSAENERFLEGGRYYAHISRFLDLFPRERLLITLFDQIKEDPDALITAVGRHIGVPDLNGGQALRERVKDKRSAFVPRPLKLAAAPLAGLIEPMRGKAWFKQARSMVARELRYPALPAAVENRLKDFYAADIEALQTLTGLSLDPWLAPPSAPSDRTGRKAALQQA